MKLQYFRILVLMGLMASNMMAFSQEPVLSDEYILWQEKVPGNPPETYPGEVWSYDETGNPSLVQFVASPTLRMFQPPEGKQTGAALIICPGGGYNILVIDREGYNVARKFSEMGIVTFVLKYRHYSKEAALQDAHRAIQLVRANAEKWGIDPDKIGIGGFSAGGHLSLNTALTKEMDPAGGQNQVQKIRCNPDYLMLAYPGLRELDLDSVRFRDGFPPLFMINAMDDNVTPVSDLFQMAGILKAENLPAEIHIFPGGGHGFDLGNQECNCSGWPDLFRNWLVYCDIIEP
jgi:acetyl esterase/lipase